MFIDYTNTTFDAETMKFEVWAAYHISCGRLIRAACYDSTGQNVKCEYYIQITKSQLQCSTDGTAWKLSAMPNGPWEHVDWEALFLDEPMTVSKLGSDQLGYVYYYNSEADTISQRAIHKIDESTVYFTTGGTAPRAACGFTRSQILPGRNMRSTLQEIERAAATISDAVADIKV